MFENVDAYSGFSVDDIDAAQRFYGDVLGIKTTIEYGMLQLHIATEAIILVYSKGPTHRPATYTILNFPVANIDEAVDQLTKKGIIFERYQGMHQDEKGIARGLQVNQGPDIAWFKDPAGNVLSVLSLS